MAVVMFMLLVVLSGFAHAVIEPNGTQSRTFLYFGYTLSKLNGSTYKAESAPPSESQLPPTFLPSHSSQPIMTWPNQTTPNQKPFPHEFILPQSGPATRDLPGAQPPRATPPADVEIIPPTSSGPDLRPLPTTPTATGPDIRPLTPPTPTGPEVRPLTSSNSPLNAAISETRPLTLSPDTVDFSVFATDPPNFPTNFSEQLPVRSSLLPPDFPENTFVPLPASDGVDLSSGLRQPPLATPLAQSFPQTIPLPLPPSASGGLPAQCSCVPAGTCITRSMGGVVDVRIVTQNPSSCPSGQQYCCTNTAIPNLPQTDTCGLPNIVPGVFPQTGQANFGEFPWSGIIMTQANSQYIGGAALITTSHLLTAAHLVASHGNGANLKIRLGEWDVSGTYEPVAAAEYAIANIAIHPSYTPVTLQNDLAVITLATPTILLTPALPQVNIACLPPLNSGTGFTGFACQVAGWGRDTWNGNLQNIVKKVDLTVMGSADCQARLRTTKLGPNWRLDTNSFICAGGEAAKDACTGDGGNALVCQNNGRMLVAGITAGGVECGMAGIPGLYVNVANYLDWITQQTLTQPPTAVGNIDPRRGG